MKPLSLGLVLAAGLAAAIVVGVAVAELAQPWIEFSLFLGLPAGIIAGAIAATAVALGLADGAPARRRRIARNVAGFGVGFLGTTLAVGVLGFGVVLALGLGVVGGMIVAAGAAVRATPVPSR